MKQWMVSLVRCGSILKQWLCPWLDVDPILKQWLVSLIRCGSHTEAVVGVLG